MRHHLERELTQLQTIFEKLCTLVNNNFLDYKKAIDNKDIPMLEKIIEDDSIVDELEINIEEECLKFLALYQPVAGDLRFIISILKINNDMERISDITANICARSIVLIKSNMVVFNFLISEIYQNVEFMLQNSIKCVIEKDAELALKICKLDDVVDDMHSRMYKIIEQECLAHPEKFEFLMNYISISRFLERIADHSTNIAEDLLYLLNGQIIRHRFI